MLVLMALKVRVNSIIMFGKLTFVFDFSLGEELVGNMCRLYGIPFTASSEGLTKQQAIKLLAEKVLD